MSAGPASPPRTAWTTVQRAAWAALGLWLLKGFAIAFAGGPGASPVERPIGILGGIAFVTALGTIGWSVTTFSSIPVRVVATVGLPVIAVFVVGLVTTLFEAAGAPDGSWVRSQAGLWVTSATLAALVSRPRR